MNRSEWRLGWKGLAAAAIGQGVAMTHFYSLGTLFEPLEREFGWSRSLVASGMTLESIITVIGLPFMGRLIDRIGSRGVALVGLVMYCASTALFCLLTNSPVHYFALWTLLALAGLAVKTPVWIAEIVRGFVRHRGLAISIVVSGTSVAAITIPLLTRLYVDDFGWRGAYLALALTGLLIAGPAVFLFFGKRSEPAIVDAPVARQRPAKLWHQIASPAFLQVLGAGMLCSFCLVATAVHLVPMLAERGVERETAARLASLFGVAALLGRLGTGLLLDRLSARIVGTTVFGFGIAGALLMLAAPSPAFFWLAVFLIGFSVGGDLDIIAYLTARIFGDGNFATLYGVMVGGLGICVGLGPLCAAMLFDLTGSYQSWFWLSAAGVSISAILIATLRLPSGGAGAHPH